MLGDECLKLGDECWKSTHQHITASKSSDEYTFTDQYAIIPIFTLVFSYFRLRLRSVAP